jgi:hypothetical protein
MLLYNIFYRNMKIDKELEHPHVSRTMRFLDGYGNEIPNAIRFDDPTDIVMVYEPVDGPNGKGHMVKKEKFHPNCIPVVDDIARPDEQQLGDVRQKYTGKRERST